MPRSPLGATSVLMLGLGLLGGMLLGAAPADAGPPDEPSVVEMDGSARASASPAASCDMLVGRAKDTRLMVVYGYARLVGYDEELELVPDILKDVEVEDGRIFTLHLRAGHRWSDGEPFTSEDFRYWWEDVANNEQLSPTGPPAELFVDGEPPQVEFLDELTVRYSWSKPNPFFLPALAGATPTVHLHAGPLPQAVPREATPIPTSSRPWSQEAPGARLGAAARPQGRHVQLRQPGPADPAALAPDHAAAGDAVRVRAQPILPPGRPERPAAALHRSGGARRGRRQADPGQDRRRRDRSAVARPVLQALHLPQGERGAQRPATPTCGRRRAARISRSIPTSTPTTRSGASCSATCASAARCRSASTATRSTRSSTSASAIGGNNTVLPQEPAVQAGVPRRLGTATIWTQANALLDEIGLTERSADGLRLLPDGRPMELIVETAGEETEQSDVLELVEEIVARARHQDPHQAVAARGVAQPDLRRRDPDVDLVRPGERHPDRRHEPERVRADQPAAVAVAEVGPVLRDQGRRPASRRTCPRPRSCSSCSSAWRAAPTPRSARAIWHEILAIYSDQVYSIGLISGVLQPVACAQDLRNVPEEAVYNWEPGAQFGIYRPDTFWFDQQ